jgi:hypothetical protein
MLGLIYVPIKFCATQWLQVGPIHARSGNVNVGFLQNSKGCS